MEFPNVCPARWLLDYNIMMPHEFISSFQDMQSDYYRPWKWYSQSISKGFGSTVENEKGNYKITLDVQYFRPNEISVKVTDSEIIVEGKHEERPDIHGFVTRQFRRRYPLPNQCPPENVTSTLSSDGVLTIIAEKKLSMNQKEKIVPIKMSGTFPRKTAIETKVTTEIKQMGMKEANNQEKVELIEEHSRLLRPELLKHSASDANGTDRKMNLNQSLDVMNTSEKNDQLKISSNSNKIEESIEKSILGLTALTTQFGNTLTSTSSEATELKSIAESSTARSSEISGKQNNDETLATVLTTASSSKGSTLEGLTTKNVSELSGLQKITDNSAMQKANEILEIKSASKMTGMKNDSQIAGMKSATEMTGMKSESEMTSVKSLPEITGEKIASVISGNSAAGMVEMKSETEIAAVKGMSKTVFEESSSSYKSFSSTSSSVKEKTTKNCFSDITKELREAAAENI